VYHQLREWMGLDLTTPACGEKTIQLIFVKRSAKRAVSLDGCKAVVTGSIFDSPTGYYSASLAIADPTISPSPGCHPHPPPAHVVPHVPADLRAYAYSLTVDAPKNVPMTGRAWRTDGTPSNLEPWSAYSNIDLTGGFAIWAGCRDGFIPVAASSSTDDDVYIDEDMGKAALAPSEDHISRFVVQCRRR
jgi:hypothetical protein